MIVCQGLYRCHIRTDSFAASAPKAEMQSRDEDEVKKAKTNLLFQNKAPK